MGRDGVHSLGLPAAEVRPAQGSGQDRSDVMERIRLVIVISNLEYGGAQRQVVELANNLDPRRFEVHVCSLSDYVPLGDRLRDCERRLHVVQKKWKFDITVVPRLAELLRRLDADIVHGYLFDAEIAARLAGRRAGTPVVVGSERNTDYHLKKRQLLTYRLTRRSCDLVVANSKAGAEFNHRVLGISPSRYRVVHNGVDVQHFKPRDARAVREELGIAADELVVGTFASFKRQKNHPLLFAAARKVLAEIPRARFLFVGDQLYQGMHGSDAYKQRMEGLIDKEGIRDRCLFLGNRDDVADLYTACDLTVLPSLFEGTPNVLLESMACGVPVVATDVSDNAYVAPDGEVGYLIELGDEDALAKRICDLLSDTDLRRRMGQQARAWVEAEFSTSRLAAKTARVYETALAESHAARESRRNERGSIRETARNKDPAGVSLRDLPYPYRALLAICSDLDETPDKHVYLEIMRFLNTTEPTSMGPGVGLEVGNTIYFDMPDDQFAYWNTDDTGRETVRRLIRSGHIDCLHSFGDLAATREHARRALDELHRHDCRLEVWIDHATAPTNFGADIMEGLGDLPGSAAYHADLSCDYGIKYVWRGRVTSVLGQEVRRRLRGIGCRRHPIRSARTVAKEAAKGFLGARGDAKYAMHRPNRLLRLGALRDGRAVCEFLRCNPHWGGVSEAETAEGLAGVLTDRMLNLLEKRRGVCILYTHLGKVRDPTCPFGPGTVAACRRLADRYHAGRVLCLTTRRALGYVHARQAILWRCRQNDRHLTIEVKTKAASTGGGPPIELRDLAGLTFFVPRDVEVTIQVDGEACDDVIDNPLDETGRRSVSLPLGRLAFPDSSI